MRESVGEHESPTPALLMVSTGLQEKDLPIRYAGFSTNFRKEAGSHGRDAWG